LVPIRDVPGDRAATPISNANANLDETGRRYFSSKEGNSLPTISAQGHILGNNEVHMTVWTMWTTGSAIIAAVWLVSEIVLGRLTRSPDPEARTRDKSSLRSLWFTLVPALIVGIYLGSRGVGFIAWGSRVVSLVGLALVVLGMLIRWIAVATLRRYFTSNVSIREGHRLIDRGMYGIIRHPSYTGSLLSFLGIGLTFANWLSTLVIFVPVLCAFLYRMRVEEQALTAHFGDDYIRYCRTTKRLVPGIY
jgi:protein-S-isoprenylcysteine O-methyltransferase Ste14